MTTAGRGNLHHVFLATYIYAVTLTTGAKSQSLGKGLVIDCADPSCPSELDISQDRMPLAFVIRMDMGVPIEDSVLVSFQASSGRMLDTVLYVAPQVIIQNLWFGRLQKDSVLYISVHARGSAKAWASRLLTIRSIDSMPGLVVEDVDPKQHRAWFVDGYLGKPLVARIRAAGSSRAITSDTCEKLTILFRPLMGGSVAPDSVRARFDHASKECRAETRWKFGAAPGDQVVQASIAGPAWVKGARDSTAQFQGTAQTPGYFAFGLLYVFRPDSLPTDTDKNQLHRNIQPMFGLDFPVMLWQWSPRWLRLFVGTSVRDPGADGYVGFSLLQVFEGPREAQFPVQAHLGLRFRKGDRRRTFIGLSLNAKDLLGSILKPLLPAEAPSPTDKVP